MTWQWLDPAAIELAHEEQIAEHGGPAGLHDRGLFESTLARPINLAAYGNPDAAALAAAYAFGLARNHPFVDGNKRTAAVAMEGFLAVNGFDLNCSDAELVLAILSLASGAWSEDALAAWIRPKMVPLP